MGKIIICEEFYFYNLLPTTNGKPEVIFREQNVPMKIWALKWSSQMLVWWKFIILALCLPYSIVWIKLYKPGRKDADMGRKFLSNSKAGLAANQDFRNAWWDSEDVLRDSLLLPSFLKMVEQLQLYPLLGIIPRSQPWSTKLNLMALWSFSHLSLIPVFREVDHTHKYCFKLAIPPWSHLAVSSMLLQLFFPILEQKRGHSDNSWLAEWLENYELNNCSSE